MKPQSGAGGPSFFFSVFIKKCYRLSEDIAIEHPTLVVEMLKPWPCWKSQRKVCLSTDGQNPNTSIRWFVMEIFNE
jgi:hypothetical protein